MLQVSDNAGSSCKAAAARCTRVGMQLDTSGSLCTCPRLVDTPIKASPTAFAKQENPLQAVFGDTPQFYTDIFGHMGGMKRFREDGKESVGKSNVKVKFLRFLVGNGELVQSVGGISIVDFHLEGGTAGGL